MRQRHLTMVAATLVAVACSDAGPAEPELGHDAQTYLGEALDVMEFNSVRRRDIDWRSFRAAALRDAQAVDARTIADVRPVIEQALLRLGDGHSFFLEPPRAATSAPDRPAADTPAAVTRLGDRFGYLKIEAFSGGGDEGDALVDGVHESMRAMDRLGRCGWVIDVRGNGGGNMWPMLAAVGPLLGSGPVGYFLYPDGMLTPWIYEAGGAGLDEGPIAATRDPWTVDARPFVALLTDAGTASAGEAIAVAFRGRERVRSFGRPTWGVSTGNAAFPLSDGSIIFLTVATMVDREGIVHGGRLVPDEVVDGEVTGDPATDPALAVAMSWLDAQPCA